MSAKRQMSLNEPLLDDSKYGQKKTNYMPAIIAGVIVAVGIGLGLGFGLADRKCPSSAAPPVSTQLDGTQASAAAAQTVQCIQTRNWTCLEGLFDDSLTAQVIGYLPPCVDEPATNQTRKCNPGEPPICGKPFDKPGFITHIKAWMSSWDNDFTYFGEPKFMVQSFDSVSMISSVNWFCGPCDQTVPGKGAFSAETVFFIKVNKNDPTKIVNWIELSNMYDPLNKTDMTNTVMSRADGVSSVPPSITKAMGRVSPAFQGTAYIHGAITEPVSFSKASLNSALQSQLASQSSAAVQHQFIWSGCGYIYGRYVQMVNSKTVQDRVVAEGLHMHTLDSNFETTELLNFIKPIKPASPAFGFFPAQGSISQDANKYYSFGL